MRLRTIAQDPRHLQIAALAGLLVYGTAWLGFDVTPGRSALILTTALIAQLVTGRIVGMPRFEPRSGLISGLSLCLLLRTPSDAVAILAAALAVGSKFAVRFRGKHVFNPTNFGIVVAVFSTGAAWVSPGQWGTSGYVGFLLACLGMVVAHRALRSDVTFAFLGAYAALLFARAFWLGDPFAIPVHQLQSGSLLLFSFFMISDPKTTPDSRAGRLLFGALVAAMSAYMQFALYRPVAALPALFLLSPLVPLFDRIAPGLRYQWPRGGPPSLVLKGADHASPVAARLAVGVHAALGPAGPSVLRLLRRQGG